MAVNIKKEMKHVWKGHGADSEIEIFIYLFYFIYFECLKMMSSSPADPSPSSAGLRGCPL